MVVAGRLHPSGQRASTGAVPGLPGARLSRAPRTGPVLRRLARRTHRRGVVRPGRGDARRPPGTRLAVVVPRARTALRAQPRLLVPFAAYLFTPLGLATGSWFAAGLQAYPLQIALLTALLGLVRFEKTGHARWLVLSVACPCPGAGVLREGGPHPARPLPSRCWCRPGPYSPPTVGASLAPATGSGWPRSRCSPCLPGPLPHADDSRVVRPDRGPRRHVARPCPRTPSPRPVRRAVVGHWGGEHRVPRHCTFAQVLFAVLTASWWPLSLVRRGLAACAGWAVVRRLPGRGHRAARCGTR